MNFREKKYLVVGMTAGLVVALGAIQGTHLMQRRRVSAPGRLGNEATAAAVAPAAEQGMASGIDSQLAAESGASVELTAQEQAAAGIQVETVRRRRLSDQLQAFGRVEEPETQLATISARIAGRVDKLYVQYTGQPIQRGQAIADIYSPEVSATAEEYRLALEGRRQLGASAEKQAIEQADDLVAASRRRLELWGISPAQISDSSAADSIPHVTIYAPSGGTIIERKVTQGQYVNSGDVLYTVADLSSVWVKADVYESDLPHLRMNQEVAITSDALPGTSIHGRVEFIEPTASTQTRTVPVHIHVSNSGMRLRPGMFVRAVFMAPNSAATLVVPRSAVLDTGTRQIAYIARGKGVFEARQIEVGRPGEDYYPVLKGLREGEQIVVNGNFLIDSQTRLTGGMTGLFGGSKEFAGQASKNATQGTAAQGGSGVQLRVRTEPDPLKGNAQAMFHAKLTDAGGQGIADAHVKVTLVMPAMPAMSMPEMRSSGELGWNGSEYAGQVRIPVAGSWNATVEASRAGQSLAIEHLRLRAQ
ncbi:MAG TPA: efflux RND transporter periplasmic adaptor subunit [Terriglobales bacterium]|nr:efflux RND transporter periplasmic adaptor subunit [Terriglobales bacterium]